MFFSIYRRTIFLFETQIAIQADQEFFYISTNPIKRKFRPSRYYENTEACAVRLYRHFRLAGNKPETSNFGVNSRREKLE